MVKQKWWDIKENVAEVASWFESRREWGKAHPTSYDGASRNGWLDDPEVTGHMATEEPAMSVGMQFGSISLPSADEYLQEAPEPKSAREGRVFKRGPDFRTPVNTSRKPLVAKTMYLISNPEMPGWLKNGESTREPWQRANEMNTAAPSDYVVERSFALPGGWSDKDFHSFMAKVAGASKREWFFMPLELAQQVIQLVLDGNGHLVDELPKADPPSTLLLVSNNLRAGLALSRKLKAQRTEVLYDAAFLAFS